MGRKYNNSHNGLNGTVQMMMRYLIGIRRAPSLTPRGRRLIIEIERLLERLDEETWTFRRELNGDITIMKHKNKRDFHR